MTVCPNCGLPKEICACESIAQEKEKIKVFSEKRRYSKPITIIKGLSKDADSKKILKEMKTRLACGGTIKNNEIELQGEHVEKVKQILLKLGFRKEQIEN